MNKACEGRWTNFYFYFHDQLPWMSGFSINVQLKVLVVDEKAASPLEYSKVGIVALSQHIEIIPVSQLRLNFNDLTAHLRTSDGVYVGPVTCETRKIK